MATDIPAGWAINRDACVQASLECPLRVPPASGRPVTLERPTVSRTARGYRRLMKGDAPVKSPNRRKNKPLRAFSRCRGSSIITILVPNTG
jgi:hypothetical protein